MWEKINNFLILNENNQNITHNSIPTPLVKKDTVKVFFSTRCSLGLNRVISFEADKQFQNILSIDSTPILKLGDIGAFDSSGIMASSLVELEKDNYFLYYIGWNKQVDVSYRLSIGLAVSEDGGNTFKKYSNGPLLDRRLEEPFFNTAPCVIKDNNIWKMWYVSCTGWEIIDNHPEPKYRIAYRESNDGINWSKDSYICIDYDRENGIESIGRPYVIKINNKFYMNCSVRKINDYRLNPHNSYTVKFYESFDGIKWTETGESLQKDKHELDDLMTCYGSFMQNNNSLYCLYNGNGFGKTGILIAEKKI